MSALSDLYKKGGLGYIEEMIMKPGNYAWEEMDPLEQGELKNKAAAEITALRGRLEKLEHLEAVAEDVNEWLKTSANLKGTAHQRSLEAALKGEA